MTGRYHSWRGRPPSRVRSGRAGTRHSPRARGRRAPGRSEFTSWATPTTRWATTARRSTAPTQHGALAGSLAARAVRPARPPAVVSRGWLAMCLAELGEFAEAIAWPEEASASPRRSITLEPVIGRWHASAAWRTCARATSAAIAAAGAGLSICRAAGTCVHLIAPAASLLGYVYALAGRVAEAVPLLEQAVSVALPGQSSAIALPGCGEAYLLAGQASEARSVRRRARWPSPASTRSGATRPGRCGSSARSPRMPTRPTVEQAEAHYRQALALAEELGMRPLVGPLPPRPRHAVPQDRPRRAGPGRANHRRRDVPRDGDDLLAGEGGGGALSLVS